MTDSGGPQRLPLRFLSTLLSQKVPEKSDTVLRCIISGQPKPEVTWYKNGQTIEEGGIASSYEFFENQYIHVLHLYCCTQNDAAVYQVSARNCFGMICCSAAVEVQCPSEDMPPSPTPRDGVGTGREHETQTSEQKSTNQADKKEPPSKEDESLSLGTPRSADSSPSESNHLSSLQVGTRNESNASSSENPWDVEGTRQNEEVCDLNGPEETADGLFPKSSNIACEQGVHCHGTAQSQSSELTNGAAPSEEGLCPSHPGPKAPKYISASLPLSEAAAPVYPGDRDAADEQVSAQVSSSDSDSDYELCPEITLTYTEEFSDDDLEYLECSDVMTDYCNAVWQRDLEGTECIFSLESDDEQMEFSKYCLGECEPFLSEMGCGSPVSDNTGPMEASAGFCGYHSRSQDGRARRCRASTHSPPSSQTGMTLTLGSHQDGTSTVTDSGRYKRPTASAENDYPGIHGERRDGHQAGEEFAGDNQLTMDEAVTEREAKRLSGELEKPGMNQCLEISEEERGGEKDLQGKNGSEKPARERRPGVKGRPKNLNPNLKDGETEGTLNHLHPTEPVNHPLAQSDKKESSLAQAEPPDPNSQFCTEGTILTQAEREAKMLQTAPDKLPQEAALNSEGEGAQVNNLFETTWVPDQSDHPQVQIREAVRGRLALSGVPAFSEPTGKESAFTGTTGDPFPNLGRLDEEKASLTQQYLETESCAQGQRRGENQVGEDNTPGHSARDLARELKLPGASHVTTSPCELPVCLPREGGRVARDTEALSVASPTLENTVPTLDTGDCGPRCRDAECLIEHLEAGDQGPRGTTDPPVGAPAHKYLPREICSTDSELLEGQSKVPDVCFPADMTLGTVPQTQASEPPPCTGERDEGGNSGVLPAPSDVLTWDISHNASAGATGEHPATVENCTPRGRERQSPSPSGGLGERRPLCSEDPPVGCREGDERASVSALDAPDTPTSHRSVVTLLQEKPTPLAAAELACLQVTQGSGDMPAGTTATKAHPAEHLPASVAENRQAVGPKASSPQAPEEKGFQLPSEVQSGHVLNGSTTKSLRELCTAPGRAGVQVWAPVRPGGDSALQVAGRPGDTSRTVDRAGSRSLGESFQETGSETLLRISQESLPHQGSLSEGRFRGGCPVPSAAQGQTIPVPLGSANSREQGGQSSGLGTGMSLVAKATVEDDNRAVSGVPPVSNMLPGESKETGLGHWAGSSKAKMIALEASAAEVWPPRQATGPECEESEAGAVAPVGVWAVADALTPGAAGPGTCPGEPAASAEPGSALAGDRGVRERKELVRRAQWSCLSPRYLSQPRFLESSVDPVEEKESHVTNLPPGAPQTAGQENANNGSPSQEESELGVGHPAFFKQFLACPEFLESSVDPVDGTGVVEAAREQTRGPSESTLAGIRKESELNDGDVGREVAARPAISPVPCPQQGGQTIPSANSADQNQEALERGQAGQRGCNRAEAGIQPAPGYALPPGEGGETVPSGGSGSPAQGRQESSPTEAEPSKNHGEFVFPALPLLSGLAVTALASVGGGTQSATGQIRAVPENHVVEPRDHQVAFSDSKDRGESERECGTPRPRPGGLPQPPVAPSPEGGLTDPSASPGIEGAETEAPQSGETKPASPLGPPAVTLESLPGECGSETAPRTLRDPRALCPALDGRGRSGERPSPRAAGAGRSPAPTPERVGKKQEAAGSGRLAEGVKKRILSKVAALRLRLEEREASGKNSSCPKKIPKLQTSVSCPDEKAGPPKPPCQREGKAPVLLEKIQAEMLPDHSGNVRLSCQFAEIHEDSTISWTKDSASIAQVQRSAGDSSTVSWTIVQASQNDQGLYQCCVQNRHGKATAEFNLTAAVLQELSSHQDVKGCEEIEFSQLIFREDFLCDSYFGDRLRGQIATEELHFGEGVHRKAFRSKVMRGLLPVFQPGRACVLKVHNAVAYGTRNNDELVQRNYRLAAQECYVQNTARYYAKIYAAEAQPLEGFGEVPEIIPIFLIHRPENNIPYATVEEELIGEFVKYSVRDGKEINVLRRDSEAGQKCCTFQHWVFEKTGGCLLVTDMQGVGMKLTDVGIATLAKGYKGFKGNCSMTFIDQFKALHQCNKYCKMLGLNSLQNNNQKQKKPSVKKSKSQPNSTTVKKTVPGTPAGKKT